MQEEGYQGWKSYETWAVALWIDNDAGSYEYWREVARECWDDATRGEVNSIRHEGVRHDATITLAQRVQEELTDGVPLTEPSMYSDLLSGALAVVDWFEIAEKLLADIKEDDDQ